MARVTDAISAANRIYRTYEHRRTERIAKEMGILIIPTPFKKQKGAYKVIDRQSIIFINDNLHPVVREIVFGHELGHHLLHREEAVSGSGFQEFNLFDMRENRMEYEANLFAAQLSVPTKLSIADITALYLSVSLSVSNGNTCTMNFSASSGLSISLRYSSTSAFDEGGKVE